MGDIQKNKPNPAQERGNRYFGANVILTMRESDAGGLLYPSPAANLVGEQREELAF